MDMRVKRWPETGNQPDNINHPKHYTQASASIEPKDVLRHAPFCLGNCLKYILRAGHKKGVDPLEDLGKARLYLTWEQENPGLDANEFLVRHGQYLRLFKRLKTVETMADLVLVIRKLEYEYGKH